MASQRPGETAGQAEGAAGAPAQAQLLAKEDALQADPRARPPSAEVLKLAAEGAMATPKPAASGVTTGDRLSFTFFLGAVLHAALIFGVTFSYAISTSQSQTLMVTLAQHSSKTAPDAPDYKAQFNQAGSGTLDEAAIITTPIEADFQDTEIREVSPFMEAKAGERLEGSPTLIATTASQPEKRVTDLGAGDSLAKVELAETGSLLLARALEIASLEARLDSQEQRYAKRPRIKRLTSLSAISAADAFYVNSWLRKIETVGNLNYPEEAKRRQLYGSLRLLVSLLPDGSVREIALLESSGHRELDAAAVRIVRLAAPFAPFPHELRQTTDILEIIRTWQFRKNATLQSR